MAIFDDGAFRPEIHGLESFERLRVTGKIAQSVWAHSANDVEKGVGEGDDTSRGGGIPNVVHEKRDGLVTETLAIGAGDEFVGDGIEVVIGHMVIGVERGNDDVLDGVMMFFEVFSQRTS